MVSFVVGISIIVNDAKLVGDTGPIANNIGTICYIDGMKQTVEQFLAEQKLRLDELQGLVDLFFLYRDNGDDAGIDRIEKRLDAMLIERGLV